MDCLLNFRGLDVGLAGHGFSTVAEKYSDVNKTAMKICRNKKPVSDVLFVIE